MTDVTLIDDLVKRTNTSIASEDRVGSDTIVASGPVRVAARWAVRNDWMALVMGGGTDLSNMLLFLYISDFKFGESGNA